ncbi:MAG: hypothetical protein O7I93_03490 [Gemmatimonadetes bacterium]|nr:hypothetical protein [Gemmatimonadota bacterium]
MQRSLRVVPIFCLGVLQTAGAQENPSLSSAKSAYAALDYEAAIASGQSALSQRLSAGELIEAYELLGFAYGALDSTRRAVEAFSNLIFLAPDREPDVQLVSPRITSLYASALGQVLVIRKVRVDSASFIAGEGRVPVRFDLSRPATAVTRVVGNDLDVQIDSAPVAGQGGVLWSPVREDGTPIPPGQYQLIIEANARRDQYSAQVLVEVRHGTVDTLPHLTSVPGYTPQEEWETPGRDWKPLGMAVLYTAIASGASLALENTGLGSPSRKEIGAVSFAVLVTGFVMSLKKPDPRPIPSGILYNQLLREELERRNDEIARQNELRRRQVLLTVVPVDGGGP